MTDTHEQDRLNALHAYHILNAEPEARFDELTQLAATICDAPIAKINLLDKDTQWTLSRHGKNGYDKITPRKKSICQYTITQSTILEVPDLTKDDRFKDLPYVKGKPHLKYYLGTQLENPDGHVIGALCILDYKERHLSEKKKQQLKILAGQVMTSLELRKQNRELTKLNREQVNLMKILSHDLRSPLSGIIGISNLLKEMVSTDNGEAQEMISLLNQSANQLNQFINDILNYTIIESKGFSLNLVKADIHSIVDNLKKLYRPSVMLKNIDLTFDIRVTDEEIWIDDEKFEQIFGNLISNAIKFTKSDGEVHSELYVQKKNGENHLILRVNDTGIGMDEEFVNQLLSGNSSNRKEGTSGEKSTGLGLSIIKHFTALHNGSVDIESKPESGTTFTISLPIEYNKEVAGARTK